jgi:hypothetical protein
MYLVANHHGVTKLYFFDNKAFLILLLLLLLLLFMKVKYIDYKLNLSLYRRQWQGHENDLGLFYHITDYQC